MPRTETKWVGFFSRMGAGATVIGYVVYLMWPASNREFWESFDRDSVFHIFGLVAAVFAWLSVEFVFTERKEKVSSQNDVRVSREILRLWTGEFRSLLKDADLWNYNPSSKFQKVREIVGRREDNSLFFQDSELDAMLGALTKSLDEFHYKVSVDTVPIFFNNIAKIGYKPKDWVPDDYYKELRKDAVEANNLALIAWTKLDELARAIKQHVPEALDDPIDISA